MALNLMTIEECDLPLWRALQAEQRRQQDHLELIASENHVSAAVLEAQGSILTNKYAEGYPGKRYYGGCEYVDEAERLAIERAKQLFQAGYANVQPHSGSQANAAAYLALMKAGDVLLGMSLAHGGHLTHGASVTSSGKLYRAVHYGLNSETGDIDYDQVQRLAQEHQPKVIVAGFSAYSGIIDWARFRNIADEVGAFVLADMAHVAGLVAAGVYPSPLPYADVVTSTTHKTLRGPRGGLILSNREDLFQKLNSAVFPGIQGGPLMHVIAAKAVAFGEALRPEFKTYQQQVLLNARTMAEVFSSEGFQVVSGGTHNHLLMLDLTRQNLTGAIAERALGEAFITVNKNAVPNDPRPPMDPSGLRLGTPAITTRGLKEKEIRDITHWMMQVLKAPSDESVIRQVREQVVALCERFPVYFRKM